MKIKAMLQKLLSVIAATLLTSCAVIPQGATAVKPFDKARYIGKWYEIARLDFRFEKDLNNVTAEYSQNDDGTIKVHNRGYNHLKKEWSEVLGKAKFASDENVGMLKVSFFGPFYAPYNIIALDKDYKYALVAGKNLDYLWILARETTIPDEIKKEYLEIANKIGFTTSNLTWVEHNK